jgi:pimeloyl-ACP methyl ester carboxylesterase
MAPVLDYEFEVTGAERSVTRGGPSLLSADLTRKLSGSGCLNDDIGYGRAMLHEAHLFDGASELGRSSAPIVIYQGAEDSVVPIALTRSIVGDLTIELFVVEGADHGFAAPGDDDLTDPATKANHRLIYSEMLARL